MILQRLCELPNGPILQEKSFNNVTNVTELNVYLPHPCERRMKRTANQKVSYDAVY